MSDKPWLTRRVFAWALFDVASSSYIALVPTLFGLYFVAVIAQGSASANAQWGALAAAALLLAGVLAPVVGAYADRSGRRVEAIAAAAASCVLACMLLPFAAGAGVLVAAMAFIVAQVGYTLASSLYDSIVIDVAPPAHRGRISAVGWGLGFLGGIVAIAVALGLLSGVEPAAQVMRLGTVFGVAGLLFGILAVPGLAGLRRIGVPPGSPALPGNPLASSFLAVASTLRHWREHRPALQVLLSFFLINDVLVTIHFFIAIVLAARFGVAVEGLLWLSLLYHLIAIPSTVTFGIAADRWGSKRTVLVMCAAIAGAILLLAFSRESWAPTAAVALLGLVFGSIQAVFRSLYASLVPAEKAAELFGFNAVAGRLSAALGPLVFGAAAAWLGGPTWALFLLLLPLGIGVGLLLGTRLPADPVEATGQLPETA